jgi:hypothetical protein
MILMRLLEVPIGALGVAGCSIGGFHTPNRWRSVLRVPLFYHAGVGRPQDWGRMLSGKARGARYLSNDAPDGFD